MTLDSGNHQTRGMAGLSSGLYAVAHSLTILMADNGWRDGVASYKYTSSVIILLHSCLEAYINEVLAIHRQLNPVDIEPRLKVLGLDRRLSLADKWFNVPKIFGRETFDKGAEPFQSFSMLICLRNTLGHYDPRFRTPSEFPSKRLARLNSKFRFSFPGQADWTSQVLNLDCAIWACRTVKSLIPKLHEFVRGTDHSSWPYPWPDPPCG